MPFFVRNSADLRFLKFLLKALDSELGDDSVSSVTSLSETPPEPSEHPFFLLDVILALLQVDEKLMGVSFLLKLVGLQIGW